MSRRGFLGVGGMAAAVMAAGGLGLEPLIKGGSKALAEETVEAAETEAAGVTLTPAILRRNAALKYRADMASYNYGLTLAAHADNGDEARYASKIGNFSKGLPHNRFGEVDLGAYNSLSAAIASGKHADFENVLMGGAAKMTNPQAGLAFDLEGSDSHFLVEPPPPALASAEEASEATELYWMSLLRDTNFNDYSESPLAAAAAAELSTQADFRGLKDASGKVTRATLFRDPFVGCEVGPYISQFMLLPTPFGTEWVSRLGRVSLPGDDHMTNFSAWLTVENGGPADGKISWDPVRRYLRDGRDLASWVHIDVLFQAYFNAALIMLPGPDASDDVTGGGLGVPLNPTNPYRSSKTQAGFGTFGPPGILGLMCEVASRALKAQWYQKWFVHRRLRPEAFGGVVHVQKTKNRYPGVLHNDILNSQAATRVHDKTGTWLLPMAFPEGSPTHPAYASGHATVAGASIT
ncbi:MAG TPA: twin-arginine translocation signal domain-containing protein, partial [Thermoanaerobaculia bacterium]|nr:twin-arginine translocation signal domain-containing protein [Thermoanaerobaculia bacterium]